MLPKEYDHAQVETRVQERWEREEIYRFDDSRLEKVYVIDTPPPYPTGRMHLGHALNWVYMDVIARYKRMRGFNVLYPQGWDCHGLPTEVKVEETHGIKKGDVPRERFREMCIQLTEQNIARMRDQMKALGYSIDWSREYITMRPECMRRTQYSFLKLHEKGLIYRGEHPVNWCPRCATAIAYAEVEYEERETHLNHIQFQVEGGHVTIATTRPELLPACVALAVNPGDERYCGLVGHEATVPLFGRKVRIIADKDVDPAFGTGIVMICTFGDKQDVEWVKKHGLEVIRAIDRDGKMAEAAGKYQGLGIEESRRAVLEDLEAAGLLAKREKLPQSVGCCWRCSTPIEILVEKQWFVGVKALKDQILDASKRMRWHPPHMEQRLATWVESMTWDWVISRQRIFATAIPVWYCQSCGEAILAREEQLPITPSAGNCPLDRCPQCGAKDFVPEIDVLDTWMDSSITPLTISGWPDDMARFDKLYPADLRPQGHEIIRTWAFYTVARCLALTGREPFKDLLINGMVLAEDGRKMSKSLGNVVEPDDLVARYGADAVRLWAAMGGTIGSDIPFNEKDVKFGNRFIRKLWNAARFAAVDSRAVGREPKELDLQDRWILHRLNALTSRVTAYLEEYRFDRALPEISDFVWHDLCDVYIEEIKHRLYSPEVYGEESREAAVYTLRKAVVQSLQLLAPYTPHFAEEVYSAFYPAGGSIHRAAWPEAEDRHISEEAERLGAIVNGVITRVRRYKAEKGLPLNHELEELSFYADGDAAKAVELSRRTIEGTLRVKRLTVERGPFPAEERVLEVVPDYSKIGPEFKGDARKVVEYIKGQKEALAAGLKEGRFVFEMGGKRFEILPMHVKEVRREVLSKGARVDVLDLPEVKGAKLVLPQSGE